MQRTKRRKIPLVFFDTEDDSAEIFQANPTCAIARNKKVTQIAAITEEGETWYSSRSDCIESFLDWLKEFGEVTVYSLNIQYDLGNLFRNELDALDVTMVGGRMISARWGKVCFRDVFNIWPMSVAKIGKAFGLEKLAFDIHSREYVFRDVEIIRRAILFVKALCSEYGVRLPSTLGGLCVNLWKARGGSNWQDTSDESLLAFYGGRVELWAIGAIGNIAWTDINSMYPSVMLRKFPNANLPFNDLPEFGIACVDIIVPHCAVAPLPCRLDDGRIFFPIGKLRGIWCCHEIRAAIRYGAKIHKLHWAKGSNKGEHYYRGFVEHFYQLRKQSEPNGAKHLFYKLLMNNLYGQLAMKGKITRSMNLTDEDLNCPRGIIYGQKLLMDVEFPIPEHCNYLHAAHITSYGRVDLLDFLNRIKPEKLLYCDTDSILFDCPKDKIPFPINDELGAMKLEGYARECKIIAPKVYRWGDRTKAKGVPTKCANEFIDTGSATYELPYKMREAVYFYDRGNKKPLSVWRTVTKELHTQYDRKKFTKKGYMPLTVTQW